jgi:hypothetical protein
MARRKYEQLFNGTARFTASTRTRLERAVGGALFGHKSDGQYLRRAVTHATRELRLEGLDVTAILAVLGSVVENAGRGCGADRSSLLSGEPQWTLVRNRVLESAQVEVDAWSEGVTLNQISPAVV